eukprot:TRINITY_DN1953_c0_g1_i1.p1 TRINITY_DN1953_c0_g1~~TRINITY_DN1953_c0_g1_i1.p1  ORF type:complete len:291 (-),score=100.81 TRINITY_DN1953_c0_g1_i1:330-1202(-)
MCIRDRVSTQSTWGIHSRKYQKDNMKSFLVVACIVLTASAVWRGNYTVEGNCEAGCCCPTGGIQVVEQNGISFNATVIGGSACNNHPTLLFNAKVDTSKRVYNGTANASFPNSTNTAQNVEIVKTRTGLGWFNKDHPTCSFTAWDNAILKTNLTKSLWTGKFKADTSCNIKSCCCPTGIITLTSNTDKIIQFGGSTQGECGNVTNFDLLFNSTDAFTGSILSGTGSLNNVSSTLRFTRKGHGILVENTKLSSCSFQLLDQANALNLGFSVILMLVSAVFLLQVMFGSSHV